MNPHYQRHAHENVRAHSLGRKNSRLYFVVLARFYLIMRVWALFKLRIKHLR